LRSWKEAGRIDIFSRAKIRARELISTYQPPTISTEKEKALFELVASLAKKAGMDQLPNISRN
jgi:trimethylamine:corrinoid methyltransferase-like protein